MKILEGSPAPDFCLQGSDGKDYTLANFRGQQLILYFYPKDDTPGCTVEARDFSALAPEFGPTVIVGVSPDSVEKHQKFISKHQLSILLLADPEKSCIRAYGAWGEKKNYGKVYEGLIRSTFLISGEGIVQKAYYNVKAAGHADRILRELGA